jgi:diguanylate cyclase (GGDEF)-like protein/PAS domain S-box-containing protein
VYERDFHGNSGFSSDLWRRLGYSDDPAQDWIEHVHPEDRLQIEDALRRLHEGETDYFREEYRIRRADGEWHWVLGQGYVVSRDKKGRPRRYIGLDVDINTQKTLERFYQNAMEEAQEKARETETLRRASAIIATSLEIHQSVGLILEQAREVIPFRVAAVLVHDGDAYEVLGITGTDRQDVQIGSRFSVEALAEGAQRMADRQPLLIANVRESGEQFLRTLRIRVGTLMAVPLVERASVKGILVFYHPRRGTFVRDHLRLGMSLADHVSIALQNARLFEQVRSQATTDSLTGLSTRRSFFSQAETMFSQLHAVGGPMTLLMVDLDYFKQVNDNYGHQEGDRLLQQTADAIRAVVRENDAVGRYGGEEFAVLLRGVSLKEGTKVADRLAEQIRGIRCTGAMEIGGEQQSMAETSSIPGPNGHLSASIGVAGSIEHNADSVLSLIRNADIALYAAKNAGRDQIVVYDESLPAMRNSTPH